MEVTFADDTVLFLSDKNIYTLFASTSVELGNVSTCFKSNKLSLNVDKTKRLSFHPPSKMQLLPQTLRNLLIDIYIYIYIYIYTYIYIIYVYIYIYININIPNIVKDRERNGKL